MNKLLDREKFVPKPNPLLLWQKEAELVQPLSFDTESELERFLKDLWALLVLEGKELSSPLQNALFLALKSPFLVSPLARTLAFLIQKELDLFQAPFIPIQHFTSLAVSCELALLWMVAEEKIAAMRLAEKLLPLTDLPTLWSKEGEYKEDEAVLATHLLEFAFGKKNTFPFSHIDAYYAAILERLPERMDLAAPHQFEEITLGLKLQKTDQWTAALSLAGDHTSLGALKAGDVEVVALGPQVDPLRDPQQFGIFRLPDSQPIETWTSLAARKEIWLEVTPDLKKNFLKLALRFLGLKREPLEEPKPVYFCFYIKAQSSEIEEKTYLPCTLERYKGDAKKVSFQKSLSILSEFPAKMELIPLAGQGSFWNAGFLLAFEVPPFEARGEYSIFV